VVLNVILRFGPSAMRVDEISGGLNETREITRGPCLSLYLSIYRNFLGTNQTSSISLDACSVT
jgi:hypothetical protein